MARYRIGAEVFWDGSTDHKPGAEITLPDDYGPSITWEPLDEAAKAALAKRADDLRRRGIEVASRVAEAQSAVEREAAEREAANKSLPTMTMSDLAAVAAKPPPTAAAKGKAQRASDRDPV